MLYSGCSWSIEPDLTLQQLNHRAFTVMDGAPAPVYALAQTRDGVLWIAGAAGLTRFDGLRFVHYPGPADPPLPSSDISAVLAAADGGLWIGFRLGGVALLRGGHLTRLGELEGLPPGTVRALVLDHEGALWVSTSSGVARVRGTRLERVASDLITFASGVFHDRTGVLWVAAGHGVLARAPGATQFREMSRETIGQLHGGTIPGFVESADGQVWTANSGRVTLLAPPSDAQPHNRSLSIAGASGSLLIDHAGNLWIAARQDVKRWPARQWSADLRARGNEAHVETLDTLTGTPEAFLEDREHNIWVGTSGGLDRFSLTNVVRAVPDCPNVGYALAAGDGGALWAACPRADSPRGELLEIHSGQIVTRRDTPAFTAAYRDPTGRIWLGGPMSIGRLQAGRLDSVELPGPLRGFDVQALASDRGGGLWVSVVRKGVYRLWHNQWTAYGGLAALPRGPAIVATVDADGAIWFGYPDNRIAHLGAGGAVRVFGPSEGLSVGNVTAIHVAGGHVWVGGEVGFARFDGARFVPIRSASGSFLGISGIVGTPDGAVWLNGMSGIAHISGGELERALRDPHYAVRSNLIDYLDGVPGPPIELRPIPSAIATTDGRVWFDLAGGLIWIDALHPVRNTLAPPVTIWSLSSAGREYPNLGVPLHLPMATTRLAFDYSAGSLTIPERVRFRYKLEGSDRDWQDAGRRREALYTNLGPGRYIFRVIAANNDGVWNEQGASVAFTITPAFHQTKWFYTLCGLLGLAALMMLYRLRVRHVAARIRGRLEERLAERERIARDLHDTLLQGIQGLIWRFQAATDRIPHGEHARELLKQEIERANRLLAESRDRVKDLRAPTNTAVELSVALAAEGKHLAPETAARLAVTVEGALRELHPIVREEVFLIAREALTNAFRHSGAHHIEARVSYGEEGLHVRVRDDGRGMSADGWQSAPASSHFGLLGMHERARRIRAALVVWSKPDAGTEIDLEVPAGLAYPRSRRSLWRRLFQPVGPRHD
jgi:signal transduction histidine kinase/ligand-binding sensor domain-containing protein